MITGKVQQCWVSGSSVRFLGSLEVVRFNKVLFGPEDLRSCAPSACCLTTETVVVAIKVEAFGWLASDTPGFFQGCYKFIIITAS